MVTTTPSSAGERSCRANEDSNGASGISPGAREDIRVATSSDVAALYDSASTSPPSVTRVKAMTDGKSTNQTPPTSGRANASSIDRSPVKSPEGAESRSWGVSGREGNNIMSMKSSSAHARHIPQRSLSSPLTSNGGVPGQLSRSLHNGLSQRRSRIPRPLPQQTSMRGAQRGRGGSLHGGLSSLPSASAGTECELEQLQKKMNEMDVRHREELYWLKLELDTTRREKEAVEDQMAELYRDLQEMEEQHRKQSRSQQAQVEPAAAAGTTTAEGGERGGGLPLDQLKASIDPSYVMGLKKQVERQEKMIRVVKNQMALVRSSTDTVIRSLKEEISDLMDEKCRVEMDLMNQLVDLEKEKKALVSGIDHVGCDAQSISTSGVSHVTDEERSRLKADIKRLAEENKRISSMMAEERKKAHQSAEHLQRQNAGLERDAEKLRTEIAVLRSSADTAEKISLIKADRDETMATLERVALLWDRADESVQALDQIMTDVKPRDGEVDENRSRLLSTLETASLVNGQVKVSLMLIELRLRNNLACLKNDRAFMAELAPNDTDLMIQIESSKAEAMSAIADVGKLLNRQVETLEAQCFAEARALKDKFQAKVEEMRAMEVRQKKLEQEASRLRSGDHSVSPGGSDLFVSQRVLERLQNEVLQVVERVKEKNETIGRLTAAAEEHKVRERSLMDELRRLMKERAQTQILARHTLALGNGTKTEALEAPAVGPKPESLASSFEVGESNETALPVEGSVVEIEEYETIEESFIDEEVDEEADEEITEEEIIVEEPVD